MARLRVVHLVDDTTAGGVMRVLDHIMTAPGLSETLDHSLRCVDRSNAALGHINADIIVSHLAISWRLLPTLIALRARHPRTAIVHVEHSYTEGFVAANVTHTRRFATLLRLSYRIFNRVVAVSYAQGDWLVRSGAVRSPALHVIQSCVDLSAFRALPAVRSPVRVIGAIGRLDRQKGFDTLITAFHRTTRADLSLLIYGEGPEEAALRQLAAGDERIRFMGFAPDPVAAMATVDAVAMPSVWEAYGLVAIEALAARRALLVNPIDGLADHLAHGAHAVGDTTVAAWERAICDLGDGCIHSSQVRGDSTKTPEDIFAGKWQVLAAELRPS
jgi:glycosyltransferase involved in cell wall biosynthesis